MLAKDDKIVLKKKMGVFDNIGEVCDIVGVEDGIIAFRFGNGMHLGYMTEDELYIYFDVVKKDTINEVVEDIIEKSEFTVNTMSDYCLAVSCRLPNGFIIVEYTNYVGENTFDSSVYDICRNKIKNKLFELETYRLCCEEYNKK